MRLPAEVIILMVFPPLGTVLAWFNVIQRPDLPPSLKGFWLVLCLLPILGPLLYLGVGSGRLW